MTGKLYTVGEVAILLGVHENTVRHWADKGLMAHGRTLMGDGHRRFKLEDINKARSTLGLDQIDDPRAESIIKEGHL